MADDSDAEKTEDPTQKKLSDALEKGDVATSQEVGTWFIMAGGTLVLMAFSGSIGASLTTTMRGLLANSWQIPVDSTGLRLLYETIGEHILSAMAVPVLLLVLAALAGNLIQHRLVWSVESLTPKLSKISPIEGAKRLFSVQAVANLIKGIVKILVLGAVLTALMWPQRYRIMALARTDPVAILPVTRSLSLKLMGAVVAIMAVVAVLDFLFQYRRWFQKQKMSLRDIKEEFKQSEGDPTIKGKQKQIRQQRASKRMMTQVPKAAVVITNPTHYAIALQYERGMEAPICVAKGVDAVALKIREIAAEHRIPTVENPPLARALHATVELDQPIPPEHYKAVAEVIGYVMRLRRAASGLPS
jgi:flagellar biosynthesis protein FlhB